VTVLIAFGAMFIALILGMPLAIGQWKGPRALQWLCTVYVEFFRGTPVLVQLLFLYFGLPTIGLAMPGWLTALIGLGLNYAAYESQIYRAALQAIPRGQWEAAYLLGMNPLLAFRRIILPQAFRIALPPMTNDFVSLFKDTSVAYAISVWELALLVARDTIVLPLPLIDWVAHAVNRPEIKLIGLTQPNTVIDSVNLPGEIQGDPADRFLIATARAHRAALATQDEQIIAYGRAGHVKVLKV